MTDAPPCPGCADEDTCERGDLQVFSMCGHEWSPSWAVQEHAGPVIRDHPIDCKVDVSARCS